MKSQKYLFLATHFISNMASKRQLFIWHKNQISMLLREVFSEEPYKHAVGSMSRGAVWSAIAGNLLHQGLKVTQRTVREKFDKLYKDFKEREKEERLASGVEVEYDEDYQALTEINDRIAEWVEIRQEKEKTEKAVAEEMRRRATEKLSVTSKRRKNSDDSEEEQEVSPNKRKRSQTSLVDVMRESVAMKKEEQEEQRALRKRELDIKAAEIEQQQQFQGMLLQQQQQGFQQQQAMNMAMLNALNELMKNIQK